MRAVSYRRYSKDNTALEVSELPAPKVPPGSALIQVKAAGVNPVDWKLMAGGLDGMMDAVFPVIPGWDVAGVVVGLGPDTPEFAIGDEVMAYARKDSAHGGTFAEQVAVPAEAIAGKPASMSWKQAAGLPLAGGTALRTLDRIGTTEGSTVLIHNAAGGVGSLAVQLAVARGATVIGTASERNHGYLRGLGAEPVSYGDGLADRVGALAPDGVDGVADFIGGQLDTTLAVLKSGGKHASVADPVVAEHGGSWVWVRPNGADLDRLAELVRDGKLNVEVAQTFPLERVGDAFDVSRDGHTRGKLVIIP
ncbi:MAG: NADP-dependent oxidoreductase [Nakamurella sp.]